MQVEIREAGLADIPLLLRHRRLMWWDMGRRDEEALALMERAAAEYFPKALSGGTYRGFVAVDEEGKIIGGGGIVISSWPGILGQLRAERAMILNLYVERDRRRCGVARSLMKVMIGWCQDNGFSSVSLHASDEGRTLYERLGFRPTNEMRLDFD